MTYSYSLYEIGSYMTRRVQAKEFYLLLYSIALRTLSLSYNDVQLYPKSFIITFP